MVLTRAQPTAPNFMMIILNDFWSKIQASETQILQLSDRLTRTQQQCHNVATKAHGLELQLKKEMEDHQICDLALEELSLENQRLTSQNQQLKDEVQSRVSQILALTNPSGDVEPPVPKHRIVFEALYASQRIDVLESTLREATVDDRLKCLDGEMDRLFARVIDLESQLAVKIEQTNAQAEQIKATNKQLEIYKDLSGHVLEPDQIRAQTNSA